MRAFMIGAERFDTLKLLSDWRWLVPPELTPLVVSMFGDWAFEARDGSVWALSMLEGTCDRVANILSEFNSLTADFEWLDRVFIAGWQHVAERHGLKPNSDECLGWTIHPMLGGQFNVANLQIFSMCVYQALMGQLHRQARQPGPS
jgi:hypothetical protein